MQSLRQIYYTVILSIKKAVEENLYSLYFI